MEAALELELTQGALLLQQLPIAVMTACQPRQPHRPVNVMVDQLLLHHQRAQAALQILLRGQDEIVQGQHDTFGKSQVLTVQHVMDLQPCTAVPNQARTGCLIPEIISVSAIQEAEWSCGIEKANAPPKTNPAIAHVLETVHKKKVACCRPLVGSLTAGPLQF